MTDMISNGQYAGYHTPVGRKCFEVAYFNVVATVYAPGWYWRDKDSTVRHGPFATSREAYEAAAK